MSVHVPDENRAGVDQRGRVPPWFGLPDRPGRRIAGRLFDGEAGTAVQGKVYLRINAPDPTVWTGIDVTTDGSGVFDFGEQRVGHYVLSADANGKMSRVVPVDSSSEASSLELYVYKCSAVTREVTSTTGSSIIGARVDIGGVQRATTDVAGKYSVCLPPDLGPTRGDLPRIAVTGYQPQYGGASGGVDAMAETKRVGGRVIGTDGLPAIGVAVQPMIADTGRWSHSSGESPIPLQSTTNERGEFELDVPKVLRWRSVCRLAVFFGDNLFVDPRDIDITGATRIEVQLHESMRRRKSESPRLHGTISGRVSWAGRSVGDVHLVESSSGEQTRSKVDGTYSLGLARFDARTVRIEVRHKGVILQQRTLDLKQDERVTEDIELEDDGVIEGIVLDADRSPVPAADVIARASGSRLGHYATSGSGGRFRIQVRAGTTYAVSAATNSKETVPLRAMPSRESPARVELVVK